MTPLMAPYFSPSRDTKTLCTVWHMRRMASALLLDQLTKALLSGHQNWKAF
uniref:Alternative protein IFT122 n=1 Tax=Homo sapiens TaxID=9606 RepID=L8E937_HUMAN|nr:alternative protein IFT122 [Homo sapiens]